LHLYRIMYQVGNYGEAERIAHEILELDPTSVIGQSAQKLASWHTIASRFDNRPGLSLLDACCIDSAAVGAEAGALLGGCTGHACAGALVGGTIGEIMSGLAGSNESDIDCDIEGSITAMPCCPPPCASCPVNAPCCPPCAACCPVATAPCCAPPCPMAAYITAKDNCKCGGTDSTECKCCQKECKCAKGDHACCKEGCACKTCAKGGCCGNKEAHHALVFVLCPSGMPCPLPVPMCLPVNHPCAVCQGHMAPPAPSMPVFHVAAPMPTAEMLPPPHCGPGCPVCVPSCQGYCPVGGCPACAPAPRAAEGSRVVITSKNGRVHVSTPTIDAECDRIISYDAGHRLVMEGTGTITFHAKTEGTVLLADRIAVSLKDGSYTINPTPAVMPKAEKVKKKGDCHGTGCCAPCAKPGECHEYRKMPATPTGTCPFGGSGGPR
jgi:hypothetical protein